MTAEKHIIVTAVSNKFFPSVLNLIGSIRVLHPQIHIIVYDLGLCRIFKSELLAINNLELRIVPRPVVFWRSCYTWKPIIFKDLFDTHPGTNILYLDAGCQLLKSTDYIFEQIKKAGYFVVDQTSTLSDITPREYWNVFNMPESEYGNRLALAAGIVGFDTTQKELQSLIDTLYDSACSGLALGFSPKDMWKNKSVNRTQFVRDCNIFRHDTTLFSLLVHRDIKNLFVHDPVRFANPNLVDTNETEQYIWNMRMNYKTLNCIDVAHTLSKSHFAVFLNKIIIFVYTRLKYIRLSLKQSIIRP